MVDFSPENRPQRGKSERTESGRTEIQDARLLKKAIRQGWISGDRFPTHVAKDELEEAIGDRMPTLVERATLTTHELLSNDDIRVKVEGVKAVVAMERQNQADAHKAIDKVVPDQHEVRHTHEEIQATLSEARQDATYVELERRRAIEAGAHAGLNGSNGKPRALDSGSAPGAN